MRVTHHLLEGVRFVPAKCVSARPFTPLAVVVHYTAGRTLEGAVRTLTKPPVRKPDGKLAGASAHVVIGRDGSLVQLVSFDRIAWHAGPSSWRERDRCNDWMIGIELVNLGCHRATAALPESDVVVIGGKRWQVFPEPQLATLEQVVAALRVGYSTLVELVGHEHIAPRRKLDPGPAFPWQRFGGAPPTPAP